MKIKFMYNDNDYSIDINLDNREPFSYCDEAIEGQINDNLGYRLFFGIDGETRKVSDTPCALDIFDDRGFYPLYKFEIIP